MRYGYAILLGENLPAEQIAYGDCADEQIVCPECRSPVFKTVRKDERDIHFLSHYRRDEALGEDCSLRVDTGPRETIERDNVNSRNQTLALFMAGIGELIGETIAPSLQNDQTDMQTIRAIEKQKALLPLVDFLARAIPRYGTEKLIKYGQESVNAITKQHNEEFKPGFGHAIQLRIATDMMTTMLTPGGRRGLEKLVRAAYMLTALTWHPKEPNQIEAAMLRGLMIKAACTSRKKATAILTVMEMTPTPASDLEARPGANRLERVFDRMLPIMASILYRMDYRGYLLRSTAGKA